MLHIRTIKKKKSTLGTVYSYRNIKRVIIKHIDSGATDKEIIALKGMVRDPFPTILNNPISVWETKPMKKLYCSVNANI